MTTLTSEAILRRINDGTVHVTGDWKVNYLLLTVTDSTHEASGDIVDKQLSRMALQYKLS